jgi:lysozyme
MSLLDGVDVASFQGAPGQWQAAAGGIGWAAVKLTELSPSRYIDPDADADWAWLGRAGKVRVGYLFGHPSVSESATVAYFIAECSRLGLENDDAVAVDLEVTDGRGPADVAEWARTVLGTLHSALGRVPLIYSYPAFIEAGNLAGCEDYPLWLSDPNHPAGRPAVPRPWTTWAIHQYQTSDQIDRDVISWPDLAAMRAALGRPAPKPAAPAARKALPMILVQVDRSTVPAGTAWPGVFLLASDGTLHHVTGPQGGTNNVESYKAAGIPGPVSITWAEYQARTAAAAA